MASTHLRTLLMLTVLVCFAASLSTASEALASGPDTLALVGVLNFPAGNGSECWGWTAPDNTEYAIMGYYWGIAFVRTTPTIALCDTVPGPMGSGGYPWREMKTYQHYAYCVSEATGLYSGISVIDLQYLPDSVHYIGSYSTNAGTAFTAHTISIDTATGYCYVEGDATEKVRILTLANPEHPVFVNSFGTSSGQIHDMTAIDNRVYVAEGSAGSWSIWDLTNKAAPHMMVRVTIPSSGYVHNVWPSPDNHYCATTEETGGKTVKFWQITSIQNIQLLGEYLGPGGLAHNAHWLTQDRLVLSHYESGVVILDVSNPANPVQIGRYDTYPGGEIPSFQGCWGAYPYTRNGYIYGSDIEGDLNVLQFRCVTLPDAPSLLAPSNGAVVTQPFDVVWNSSGSPQYHLKVDDDPGFGSPVVDTIVTDTTLSLSGLTLGQVFHWRVSSKEACGEGAPSTAGDFQSCAVAITGDVNYSGSITSGDIVYLVNYVFKGGALPLPIEPAGDVNCSSTVNSADIIYLVNFTFKSGSAPCNVCSIL